MSNYLVETINHTKASLPYMVHNWTAEQKSAAELKTTDNESILSYTDFCGVIDDHFYLNMVDLFHSANSITVAEAATMVYNKYIRWKNRRIDNIRRAYAAMLEEYNPLYNYDRYEDAYTDTDETTHGKKVSRGSDVKTSTNTDFKSGTATDLKTSTNTDLTSSINTNMQEAETMSSKKDIRPTWVADNQQTAKEETTPGTKTTSGSYEDNYTNTEGAAANNYNETKGDYAKNYTRAVGVATDNYTQTVGNALNNFDEESGKTTTDHIIDDKHLYGNIGTTKTQEMLQDELNIRKYDLKFELVKEFVESISYFCEEVD